MHINTVFKNPNRQEADQLIIYKESKGVEPKATEDKSTE